MSLRENPKFLQYIVYTSMLLLFIFPSITLSIDRNKNMYITIANSINLLLAIIVLIMFIKKIPIMKVILFSLLCLILVSCFNIYIAKTKLDELKEEKIEMKSLIAVNSVGICLGVIFIYIFTSKYHKMIESKRELTRSKSYRAPLTRSKSFRSPLSRDSNTTQFKKISRDYNVSNDTIPTRTIGRWMESN